MAKPVLAPAHPLVALGIAVLLSVSAAAAGPGAVRQVDLALTGEASSTSAEAEQRGQQALASLRYPWRELGYTIEFRDYSGGRLGSANSRTKHIVIYVKRGQSDQSLRVTIAHELGHALDFEHGTVRRRDDYRVIRRIDRHAAWYPCDGCTDYRSHAGDWSEVFAYWLAGPGDFRSQVAGPPTAEQLRRLEPLFAVPRPQPAPPPRPSPSPSPSPTSSPTSIGPVSGNAVPSLPPVPRRVAPSEAQVAPEVQACLPPLHLPPQVLPPGRAPRPGIPAAPRVPVGTGCPSRAS